MKTDPTWKPAPAPEKWGQCGAVHTNDNQFKKRLRALKVPQKLGINLTEALEKRFIGIVQGYDLKTRQMGDLPSKPEYRALMLNLSRSAAAFADSLEAITHCRISHGIKIDPQMKAPSKIKELVKIARQWGSAADNAVPEKRPGNKTDPYFHEFVQALAEWYLNATGEKPIAGGFNIDNNRPTNNFATLVLDTLEKIGRRYQSTEALLKQLISILTKV